MRNFLFLVPVAILLGGCPAHDPGLVTTLEPVCDALIGPIPYSKKPESPRHAGPALRPDLAKRNQVGVQLNCPAYK